MGLDLSNLTDILGDVQKGSNEATSFLKGGPVKGGFTNALGDGAGAIGKVSGMVADSIPALTVINTAADLLGGLFKGKPRADNNPNASPEFARWVQQGFSPPGFLDWLKLNRPDAISDLNTVKMMRYIYEMTGPGKGRLNHTANPSYMVDGNWNATARAFREIGIDLEKSSEKQMAADPNWKAGGGDGIHPNTIAPENVTSTKVDPIVSKIKQDIGEGKTTARTKDKRAANDTVKSSDNSSAIGILVVLILIALVWKS